MLFRQKVKDRQTIEQEVPNTVEIHVGRQPIYSSNLDIFGYQLIYRVQDSSASHAKNGEQATSLMILNTFVEIGLKRVVGDRLPFVKVGREFLLNHYDLPVPPENIILDVNKQEVIDQDLVNGIQFYTRRGYWICLADFEMTRSYQELLKYVHIAKINTAGLDKITLSQKAIFLRHFRIKLLADKLETRADFDLCKSLGFDYFQGYFLARPNIVRGRRIPARRLAILEILSRLFDSDVDMGELERIIRQDVSLSYKILRMVNSAYYAMGKQIESIRQAILILGIKQLRAWLILLIVSEVNDQPSVLMTIAMIRGRMCELLARMSEKKDEDRYFTVGLLSALDAILNSPMERVLDDLPLSDEIDLALINHEGSLGQYLSSVLAYEQGNWGEVDLPGLSMTQIREAYLQAIAWASEMKKLFDS